MSWKEESVMSQRLSLVEQLLLPGADVSKLSDKYGVSCKTAYKWLNRYKEGGIDALEDKSREPIHQPNKTPDEIEQVILVIHKQFPCWGPYKLQQYLINEKIIPNVPSHPTIGNILKRHGYEVIKNNKSHPAKKRFEKEHPNELWQMDFKGSFMTKEHRCHPLTVLDDYSRFSIVLKACKNETNPTVKSHLTTIFKEFGLPEQINVDNGSPWGASDLESYTSLTIWLIKLGIRLSHSAPFHPQTNGKDERFHRSLKLEVLHQRQYKNHDDIQLAFDKWQHIYNFKRPHQGIGNRIPSSRYQISAQKFPDKLPGYDYGHGEIVRKVSTGSGLFSFKGKEYRAGRALCNEYIAIKETEQTEQFAIYFMDRFIKKFALKEVV